jgi:prevent-host-death family protein
LLPKAFEINIETEGKQMKQVSVEEAGQKLKELLGRVACGDEIVITDDADRPVAKLVSVRSSARKREAGHAKGRIRIADDFDAPLQDFSEYMP